MGTLPPDHIQPKVHATKKFASESFNMHIFNEDPKRNNLFWAKKSLRYGQKCKLWIPSRSQLFFMFNHCILISSTQALMLLFLLTTNVSMAPQLDQVLHKSWSSWLWAWTNSKYSWYSSAMSIISATMSIIYPTMSIISSTMFITSPTMSIISLTTSIIFPTMSIILRPCPTPPRPC